MAYNNKSGVTLRILKVKVESYLSDKSGNLYKMNPNKCKQMLHKEAIKHYKKVPPNFKADLNKEAEQLVNKLKVNNWIEKFNIKNCIIITRVISVIIQHVDQLIPPKHNWEKLVRLLS